MRNLVLAAAVVALSATATLAGPAHAAPCAGFNDVDAASVFCADVEWAKNRAITQGCAPAAYCPDAATTRLQMAVFLRRFGSTMAAMHWVDPADAFIGRAGPGPTLELTVAAQRVLLPMAPSDPSGWRLKIDSRFEFEGAECTGRRFFPATIANTGARTLATVVPEQMGIFFAWLSGNVDVAPFIASQGDFSSGALVCTNVAQPGVRSARHEAVGPFALPAIAFPLYLR